MDKGCLCKGSILTSSVDPSPSLGHGADDGLAAGLHRDMLDPDHLLALAAMAVESLGEGRERARQPVAVFQPQLPALEGLIGQTRPAEALHGGLVRRHHLRRQHAFDDIARADADQPQQSRRVAELLVSALSLAPRQTELRTWLAA